MCQLALVDADSASGCRALLKTEGTHLIDGIEAVFRFDNRLALYRHLLEEFVEIPDSQQMIQTLMLCQIVALWLVGIGGLGLGKIICQALVLCQVVALGLVECVGSTPVEIILPEHPFPRGIVAQILRELRLINSHTTGAGFCPLLKAEG